MTSTGTELRSEIFDPNEDQRWQRFVEASVNGGVFHHVEWLRLLQAQYHYRLRALCVSTKEGEIRVGVPFAEVRSRLTGTRLVALPFSDSCAPVLREMADELALPQLVQRIRSEHLQSGITVEIRAPVAQMPVASRFYHHQLALEPSIEDAFSQNARRSVKRAAREGVRVLRMTDVTGLNAFYRLHLRTRRRQGVPTQPKQFIDRFQKLFDVGLGFVLVAHWQERPVAAALFLSFNGALTYKYGASAARHLDKRPNHAIFSEAIRWGRDHGYRTLDLGRTDLDNEGLRSFKRSWGAQEQQLSYSRLPPPVAGTHGAAVPRPLKMFISGTPPLAGRLVGEALYRHYG